MSKVIEYKMDEHYFIFFIDVGLLYLAALIKSYLSHLTEKEEEEIGYVNIIGSIIGIVVTIILGIRLKGVMILDSNKNPSRLYTIPLILTLFVILGAFVVSLVFAFLSRGEPYSDKPEHTGKMKASSVTGFTISVLGSIIVYAGFNTDFLYKNAIQ